MRCRRTYVLNNTITEVVHIEMLLQKGVRKIGVQEKGVFFLTLIEGFIFLFQIIKLQSNQHDIFVYQKSLIQTFHMSF